MFIKYRNFEFVSKDKIESSSILTEYVVRATVEQVIKFPFFDEKVQTVEIFLNTMFWKFESDGKYVPDSIEKLIDIWEMKNKKKLSAQGSYERL